MRIGIVACEILKPEIELITANDPEVVHREYLEMGLHDYPEKLREVLVEKVNALEGKVDAVFIGYAICKSLDCVPSMIRLPFVMLREEDCIGCMLGAVEYAKERSICPGTWFSSPGWAVLGIDALVNDSQMEGLVEQGYDKLYFAKAQLDGYSRCLFLYTGVGDREIFEELARSFAAQLNLRFESREADFRSIRAAWEKVKLIGRVLQS